MRLFFTCLAVVMTHGILLTTQSVAQEAPDRPTLVLATGGHTDLIQGLHFRAGGKELVSVGRDGSIQIWDLAAGRSRVTHWLPPGVVVRYTELSASGRFLAVSARAKSAGSVLLLVDLDQPRNCRQVYAGPSSPTFRFLPGQDRVVWEAKKGMVTITEAADGKTVSDFKTVVHAWSGLDISQDGKKLLLAGPAEGEKEARLAVHGLPTGAEAHTFPSKRSVLSNPLFSPDGTRILAARNTVAASLVRWASDGKLLWEMPGADCWPAVVRKRKGGVKIDSLLNIGRTENVLIAWSCRTVIDEADGLWGVSRLDPEARTVEVLRQFGSPCEAVALCLTPDGATFAAAGGLDRVIYICRTADGKILKELSAGSTEAVVRWAGWQKEGRSIAWSFQQADETGFRASQLDWPKLQTRCGKGMPDGFTGAITASGNVKLRKQVSKQVERWELTRNDTDITPLLRFVSVATLVPKSDLAAFGGTYGSVRLFDTKNADYRKYVLYANRTSSRVTAMAPSPDGRFLLVASADQVLRVFDLETVPGHKPSSGPLSGPGRSPEPLLSLHVTPQDDWIAWTPQGYYAASPGGERLIGWVVSNGPDQLATFHPAERFRKSLYRPDIISKVLELGSVEKAVKAANKAAGAKPAPAEVTQVLPPAVRFILPSEPVVTLTSTGKLEIEAEADSTDTNPVEALQLMIENRPYKGEAGLVRSPDGKPGKVTGRWAVEFPTPGTYKLYVRVEGKQSNGATGMVIVNYAPKEGPGAIRPRLHVLAIGIDEYPKEQKLKCAVNDAKGLQAAFAKYSGALYEVRLHPLLNEEATRGRILDKLLTLRKDTAPKDVVVIFYAGHGFRSEKQFFLQPYGGKKSDPEKTCISSKELRDAVVNLNSLNVVVIIDACHGGAPSELIRELADEGCGAGVFCAAQDFQTAGERDGHGYFTRALIEALEGKEPFALPKDRQVKLTDISGYVFRRVLELSDDRQTPVCLARSPIPLTKQ